MKFEEQILKGKKYLKYDCPGCGFTHMIPVKGLGVSWAYNNNIEKPTLTPSVKMTTKYGIDQNEIVCHHFLRGGVIEFLSDCKGQKPKE